MLSSHRQQLGFLLILAVFALLGTTRAQQAAPPVPSMKPGPNAHWTITYQLKESENSKKSSPSKQKTARASEDGESLKKQSLQSEEYQLNNDTAVVIKHFSDGSTQEVYIVSGIGFLTDPVTKAVRAERVDAGTGADLRFSESFPGLDWLQSKYFVDIQEQGGARCLHFRQQPTPQAKPADDSQDGIIRYDPDSTTVEREAWVNAESSLPVAFRRGNLSGTYQHQAATTRDLLLPDAVKRAVQRYKGE